MTLSPNEQVKQQEDARLELLVARANAIQAYATLEQSLCSIFAHCLEAKPDKAGIVFFRLSNARSRNYILEQLLKRTYGDTYSQFWSSSARIIGSLDHERNEIVHWQTMIHVGDAPTTASLVPPNFWTFNSLTPQKTPEHLRAFSAKADFMSRLLNMFHALITGMLKGADAEQPWLDICQQEVVYPPPDNHPLSRTGREH